MGLEDDEDWLDTVWSLMYSFISLVFKGMIKAFGEMWNGLRNTWRNQK